MQKYKLCHSKERVSEAKNRLKTWYDGKTPDYIPFVYSPDIKKLFTIGEMAACVDKAIEGKIHEMNSQLAGFPDCDYIPCLNLSYLGEGLIPTMFGAKQRIVEKNPPFTEGRVITDLERDLPSFPKKVDFTSGWGPILKETIEKFLDATNGEIPIGVCDHQSPYGIATKLIGNEDLMIAMYDTPGLVHELMEICTNAIIDTIRETEKWVGNADLVVKNIRIPIPQTGMILWDDYISVLSPDLHREFCLPYNMRLYREFGSGHLHTCGPNFPNFIDSILAHDVKSIDIGILRNMSKTREDMLLLKQYADRAGVKLTGTLAAYPVSIHSSEGALPPDADFVQKMAAGGNLLWTAGGSREKGLEYLKIVRSLKISF